MTLTKVHALTPAQVMTLCELYQQEWWTKGRSPSDVAKMVAHSSMVFGLVGQDSTLVAFARILTDRVYKAFIFDVIVAASERKKGLGAELMNWILSHPEISSVRHFELYCAPEMVMFYERWGFSTNVGGISLMRRAA